MVAAVDGLDQAEATDIKETILDAIGNTPLVRLHKVARGVRPALLAKVASGELSAATSHDGATTWTIRADSFVIEIFDDAHKVDYVERVTDAAGKTVTFDRYMNAYGYDPIDRLSPDIRELLSQRMYGDYMDRATSRR